MRWGTGDNYCYVLTDDSLKSAWVIDPAEPHEVLPQLPLLGVQVAAIVNTHHHYDHLGGNSALLEAFPGVPLIGGKDSPQVLVVPEHRQSFTLGTTVVVTALHTPCHTQDSVCYYAHDLATDERAVFTGDTLFTSGCGRFFEGTGAEMDTALNLVLGSLPEATRVYPGHEYTRSNLKFSATVLDNAAIRRLAAFCDTHEHTTGEFTIGDEKAFNPFMRLDDPAVQRATGQAERAAVMDRLREMKNLM